MISKGTPMRGRGNEPELGSKEWMRYVIFACLADVAMMLFAAARLAQVMVDEAHWLREAVPPVADLFLLGLAVIFSLKTLTVWRKSETHPKRRDRRTLVMVLLSKVWFFFILGSYIEPLARWLLVDYA